MGMEKSFSGEGDIARGGDIRMILRTLRAAIPKPRTSLQSVEGVTDVARARDVRVIVLARGSGVLSTGSMLRKVMVVR